MIEARHVDQDSPVAVESVVLPVGNVTANGALAAFSLPYAARLRRVDVSVASVAGTTPTMQIQVSGSVSGVLSTTAAITAAGLTKTQASGVTAQNEILTVSATAVGGTSPSFTGVTVTLHFVQTDRDIVGGATKGVSF